MIKNILIKGSGDITDSQLFFNFVVEKARYNHVVVICGGGTRINIELERQGFFVKFDSLGRRITSLWEERIIMRDVLEMEEMKLQNKFLGHSVIVIPPILYAGAVLCPINGDDLVKAYELGFDEIYVVTTMERIAKKKQIFEGMEKVEIIGI